MVWWTEPSDRIAADARGAAVALVRVDGAQYSVPSHWSGSQATAYVGVADIVLKWREERITVAKRARGSRTVKYKHPAPPTGAVVSTERGADAPSAGWTRTRTKYQEHGHTATPFQLACSEGSVAGTGCQATAPTLVAI